MLYVRSCLMEPDELLTICSFCIYYKLRSDTAYTRIFTVEGHDNILRIDVAHEHNANFHGHNCGVLGGVQWPDWLTAL